MTGNRSLAISTLVRGSIVALGLFVAVIVVSATMGFLIDTSRSAASRSVCALKAWRHLDGTLVCVPQAEPPGLEEFFSAPTRGSEAVDVDIAADQLTVVYDVALPKSHPLVTQTVQGNVNSFEKKYDLHRWLLGWVSVRSLEPGDDIPAVVELDDPVVSVDETLHTAHLRVTSLPLSLPAGRHELRLEPPEDSSIRPRRVTVRSRVPGTVVHPYSVRPATVGERQVVFQQAVPAGDIRLVLDRPPPERRADGSLAGLSRLGSRLAIPVAGWALVIMALAVPLLFWLYRVRQDPQDETEPNWSMSLAATAVFVSVVTLVVIAGAEAMDLGWNPGRLVRYVVRLSWWPSWFPFGSGPELWQFRWVPYEPIQSFLSSIARSSAPPRDVDSTDPRSIGGDAQDDGAALLAVLAVGVVVPFVLHHRHPRPWEAAGSALHRSTRRLRGLGFLAVLLAVPLIVQLGRWVEERHWIGAQVPGQAAAAVGQPLGTTILVPRLAGLALVLAIALGGILLTVLPLRTAMLGGLVGGLAAVDLALLIDLPRRSGSIGRMVTVVVLLIVAIRLLAALVGLALTVARRAEWGRHWGWAVAAAIAVLALALPYRLVLDGDVSTFEAASPWRDANEVATASIRLLWMLAIVWILVRLRASDERHGQLLPVSALWLGVLLSMLTVFRPYYRVWYLPVVLLTGVALLRYWLVVDQPAPVRQGKVAGKEQRFDLISQGMELRRSERQLDQDEKGDINSDEHAKRLSDATRHLEDRKRQQRDKWGETADVVCLNIGPRLSPWASGRLCAAWAAGFSLPWIVLYVRRVAIDDPGDQFPQLWGGILLAEQLLAWISIGFLFGYFYTALLGRNGLEKGVWVAVALIVPRAVFTVLIAADEPDAWSAFGLWATQVASLSLLLGFVAGDLATLSSVGLPWRKIRDLHELRWLAGWASSLVLAIGGVVTGLLTGALGSLIQLTADYALKSFSGPGP